MLAEQYRYLFIVFRVYKMNYYTNNKYLKNLWLKIILDY